jgi:hypothetical protein
VPVGSRYRRGAGCFTIAAARAWDRCGCLRFDTITQAEFDTSRPASMSITLVGFLLGYLLGTLPGLGMDRASVALRGVIVPLAGGEMH